MWGEPLDAANFRRSLALDTDAAYAMPARLDRRARPRGRPPARALPRHRELDGGLTRQAPPPADDHATQGVVVNVRRQSSIDSSTPIVSYTGRARWSSETSVRPWNRAVSAMTAS